MTSQAFVNEPSGCRSSPVWDRVTKGQTRVLHKQDKATGKINLIQEFDKEAEGQTSKPKESKSKQNRKDKEKSVVSSETVKGQQPQQGEKISNANKSTHLKQTNDSTKSSVTGGNKTDDTNVPNSKEQVPSKDESTGEVLSDQGKSGSNVPPNQVGQSNPDHQSDKKMTAQQWAHDSFTFIMKGQQRRSKRKSSHAQRASRTS
jgi:hypothetical protein